MGITKQEIERFVRECAKLELEDIYDVVEILEKTGYSEEEIYSAVNAIFEIFEGN